MVPLVSVAFGASSTAPTILGGPFGKCEANGQRTTGSEITDHGKVTLVLTMPYQTVLASPVLRVYRVINDFVLSNYYVCLRSTGQTFYIGRSLGGGAESVDFVLDDFTTEGDFVAFDISASRPSDRFESVDARTGKIAFESGQLSSTLGQLSNPTALVLTDDGAIAYLDHGQLTAIDSAGTENLAGPAAGPITDLAASGQTVYWTQAGAPHAATLS